MSADREVIDFDAEGISLLRGINQAKQGRGDWKALDSIFHNENTGGSIFVGDESAAHTLSLLQSHNITHVVNCTHGLTKIADYFAGTLFYYEFPIADWRNFYSDLDPNMLTAFINPLFAFIDSALAKGASVLVHCLAGAHRAGTTGCLCLMHFANLDVATAIASAKKLRPIIDPMGHLRELLNRFQMIRELKS